MLKNKNLNLLPDEYKNKFISRYVLLASSAVGGLFALVIVGMMINLFICNISLQNFKKQNTEFINTKAKITDLQKQIEDNRHFIDEQSKQYFGFYSFLSSLQECKPNSLTIISLDSMDRLQKSATAQPTPTATPESSASPEPSAQPNENSTEQKEQNTDKKSQIQYQDDLSGQKLVLRGMSDSYLDVSAFIYKVSHIPNVSNIELSGMEEQPFQQNRHVIVFEAILEVH